VDLAEQGDLPLITALALGDLAVAQDAAGQTGPAAEARDRALALYDAKGDIASADRLRRRLASG
jgi:hypothetical protein